MIKEEIEFYSHQVEDFYKFVQECLAEKEYLFKREIIKLNEEKTGIYDIEKLLIYKHEKNVAEIIPIGLDIIGANGRVDLVTPYEIRKFLYFKNGGPVITTKIDGKKVNHKVFTGIDEDGWYWVESITLKKAYKIEQAVFLSLFDEVISKWVI